MSNRYSTTSTPNKSGQRFFDIWWGKVIAGIGCFGLAYVLHLSFTDIEVGTRESIRVPWYIAILYYTLGHIPTIALVGLIGLVIIVVGLWQFAREGD